MLSHRVEPIWSPCNTMDVVTAQVFLWVIANNWNLKFKYFVQSLMLMYDTFSKSAGDLQRALNVTSTNNLTIEYLLPETMRAMLVGRRMSVLLCDWCDNICIDKHEFKKSKILAVCNVPADSFHEDTQRQKRTRNHASSRQSRFSLTPTKGPTVRFLPPVNCCLQLILSAYMFFARIMSNINI